MSVVCDDVSAMVCVDLKRGKRGRPKPLVVSADVATASELARTREELRSQHSQWVYFDRGLRIYDGRKTFMFKPMQRMLWTTNRAWTDADEIIADTLTDLGA